MTANDRAVCHIKPSPDGGFIAFNDDLRVVVQAETKADAEEQFKKAVVAVVAITERHMKPGSSARCTAKGLRNLRCHLHAGHDGPHTAPSGRLTVRWETVPS